jgi:hypothetical protein
MRFQSEPLRHTIYMHLLVGQNLWHRLNTGCHCSWGLGEIIKERVRVERIKQGGCVCLCSYPGKQCVSECRLVLLVLHTDSWVSGSSGQHRSG